MSDNLINDLLSGWPYAARKQAIIAVRDDLPAPAATRLTRCGRYMVLVNPRLLAACGVAPALVGRHELGHVDLLHVYADVKALEPLRTNVAMDCEVNSHLHELHRDPFVWPARFNLPDGEDWEWYYAALPNEEHSSIHCSMSQEVREAVEQAIAEELQARGLKAADGKAESMPSPSTRSVCKSVARRIAEHVGRRFDKEFEKHTANRPHKWREDRPGKAARYAPRIVYAMDCSGSVGLEEVKRYAGWVRWLTREYDGLVVEFDSEVRHLARAPSGKYWGGGTDFRPVYALPADLYVFFTDAEGPWPAAKPRDTLVVLTSGGEAPNWADKIGV